MLDDKLDHALDLGVRTVRAALDARARQDALTVESGLARRARIVLLASEQRSNTEIASLVGVSRPTVLLWRGRYAAGGLAVLRDLDRPGRPWTVSAEQVVVATLTRPPATWG